MGHHHGADRRDTGITGGIAFVTTCITIAGLGAIEPGRRLWSRLRSGRTGCRHALIFLVVEAFQTGWSTLQPLLFRSLRASSCGTPSA